MNKLNIAGKDLIFPAVLLLICLVLAFASQPMSDLLRYDSQALRDGEIWRLLTPHFVHLGWSHFAMNMFGLFLVFFFFASCLSWQYWLSTFTISALSISGLIFFLNPEIQWYVGMSGVLHALFIVGGLADIVVRKWEGITFTALVIAKVIYEQTFGPLPGSEEAAGGKVLTDAHFYGAIIGGVIGVYYLLRRDK